MGTQFSSIFVVVLVLLLSQFASAETIPIPTLNNGDIFLIEGNPFKILIIQDGVIFISSQFHKLSLKEGGCGQRDKYRFCYKDTIDLGDTLKDKRYQAIITVETMCDDCVALGNICMNSKICASGICSHGSCRESIKYCGDTFCDDEPNCPEDCQIHSYVRLDLPFTNSNIELVSGNHYKLSPYSDQWSICIKNVVECMNGTDYLHNVNGTLIFKNLAVKTLSNETTLITIKTLTAEEQGQLESKSGEIVAAAVKSQIPNAEFVSRSLYQELSLLNDIATLKNEPKKGFKLSDSQLETYDGQITIIRVKGTSNEDTISSKVSWQQENSVWIAQQISGDVKLSGSSVDSLNSQKTKILGDLKNQRVAPAPTSTPTPTPVQTKKDDKFNFTNVTIIGLIIIGGAILYHKKKTHSDLHFKGKWFIFWVLLVFGVAWLPFVFVAAVFYIWMLEPDNSKIDK